MYRILRKQSIFSIVVLTIILSACSKDRTITIRNFEECVSAGFTVTNTFPAQCRGPNGHVYMQNDAETALQAPIEVYAPSAKSHVDKVIAIHGRAKGPWYFEATFPIELRSSSGTVIAQSYGTTQGTWMTENWVPFSGTLIIPEGTPPQSVTLILKKANPSGLPEHSAEIHLPLFIDAQ